MSSSLFDKLRSRADTAAQTQHERKRPPAPAPDPSAGLGLGVDALGRPIVAGFVGGEDVRDSLTYVRSDEYKAPRADTPLTEAQKAGYAALLQLARQQEGR